MKRILALASFVLVLAAIGCKKEEPKAPDLNAPGGESPGQEKKTASNAPPAGLPPGSGSGSGNTVNVTPIGGVGAGPMTPVSGAENIQGGGSGAGQVMKERARGLAGQSPSSVNQMGSDDN